jgi:uncharacterized membrane protein
MRKMTTAIAGAAVATMLVGGAGLAYASASPATAAAGTEDFYLMTTSGTATTIPVIANGVFTAAGVDHTGNTVDTAVFPTGSFKINHGGPISGTPKLNPATCFFTFTGKGKFTISGGTGAYKGISGSGKVVITIVGITGRTKKGACSENGAPVAWQQTYSGVASVKL